MSVVTSHERDETAEEFELRKQRETEKPPAQRGKKGKTEDLLIGKVREVKLANVEMGGNPLPTYSKWLSSQLQILKDVKWQEHGTGEGLWSRIYPQQDGVPVYNPSGKYWVKLFSFGAARLVEIDSRVPVTSEDFLLLPRSSTIRDIWPMLLSKAFLQLHSSRWRNISQFIDSEDEELDGSFIYALTGLLPQHLNIAQIDHSEWSLLEKYLCDTSWEQRRVIVSAHCKLDKSPFIPSMSCSQSDIQEEEDKSQELKIRVEGPRPGSSSELIKDRSPSQVVRDAASHALQISTGRHYSFRFKPKPCFVVPGFGYLLFELFANPQNFDMKKAQKREQVKLADEAKMALLRAKATSPARKLKRHQSPARLREYQKRKLRRDKEKEERRQKLLEPKEYAVYRLLKLKTSVTNIPVVNIEAPFTAAEITTAKIMIFNSEHFLQRELDALDRLMEREDVELFNPGDSNLEDFKLDDDAEEDLAHLPQPRLREKGGAWVSSEDFPSAFQNLILYHDQLFYPYNLVLDDLWKDPTQSFVHNEDFDVWVIVVEDSDVFEMLVGFSPQFPEALKSHPHFSSFSLLSYDFESETELPWEDSFTLTTTSTLGTHLALGPGNYILRPVYNCCPCGAMVWVSSTAPVATFSKFAFLTERKGWVHSSLSFAYMATPQNLFSIPVKAELSSEVLAEVYLKVTCTNPNVLQYSELSLIDRDTDSYERSYRNLDLKSLQNIKITVNPNGKGYRLLLQVFPVIAFPDCDFTLKIVTRSESVKLNANELLEPLEYSDKYTPNKYGTIFKEHLFTSEDLQFTAHVRLRRGPLAKNKDLAGDLPVPPPHSITLELYEDSTLLASSRGLNSAFIRHINIDHPTSLLLLLCKYDLREWPEAKFSSEDTENLFWVLRIVSSDSVAVVKDTRKEDNEEAIRKSWEAAQPGRAELARMNRNRYLAQVKQLSGAPLSEQEQELLKETFEERRKARKEIDASAKKGKPKEEKKKEVEKQEEPEELHKTHVIAQIRDFLNDLGGQRLTVLQTQETFFTQEMAAQASDTLSTELAASAAAFAQKTLLRDSYKQQSETMKAHLKAIQGAGIENFNVAAEQYRKDRGAYQSRFEALRELTTKLQTALTGTDVAAIETLRKEAETANCDPKLLAQAAACVRKLRVQKASECLRRALQDINVLELAGTLGTIEEFELECEFDFRLVHRAKLLVKKQGTLLQVIENPENYTQEQFEALSQETPLGLEPLLKRANCAVYTQLLTAATAAQDKETVKKVLAQPGKSPLPPELLKQAEELLTS